MARSVVHSIIPSQSADGIQKSEYHVATQMALAHNMQIRSLNAIYIQAASISSPNDIVDFLVYCQIWYEMIHHHHAVEETFLFPELEKQLDRPGLMNESVEQHKAFHGKLEVWGKKCYEMGPQEYKAEEWRRMIDDFAKPLLVHLHDEVDALVKLADSKPDPVVVEKLWKVTEAKGKDDADKVEWLHISHGVLVMLTLRTVPRLAFCSEYRGCRF
jgi:hypothetical protein